MGLRLGVALALTVLVGALALLGSATHADAVTPCGKQVVEDWLDDGRIDRLYELHCYEEGIDAIPSEIRDYSNAEDAIRLAYLTAGGGLRSTSRHTEGPVDPTVQPRGPVAAPRVDTGAATDLPLPVLVLGAMSIVIVAAGALGYLSRRRRA